MLKVLIGTTNPSKVNRFKDLLNGYEIEFLTLNDLNIVEEPNETGKTPEDNAAIKANFYGKFFDIVICNDSGLYFDTLPLNDKRQPGLHIRSPQNKKLNDEEMIEYYSNLVTSLGGKILAYYLDGIAVYNKGKIYKYMENSEATKLNAFYLVDKVHPNRHIGWPLDSISINKNTNKYFVESNSSGQETTKEQIILGKYKQRLVEFLLKSLNI